MKSRPTRLVFAASGLTKGSGGIAELSRQTLKSLLDLHRQHSIRLEVHVLDDAEPTQDDELFRAGDLPLIRWYSGNRWKFSLNLLISTSSVRLFDHVGLARAAGLMPSALGSPYILMIHGVEIWENARPDYLRTARNAGLLIANSDYTAQRVRARYPDLPEIRVCRPGKDEIGSGISRNHQMAEDLGPHAMLIVGRLSGEQRHKGHDHLIDALPQIRQAVPDVQLVIAGEGDDRPRLEAKAVELGVADEVIFTGWVDEERLSRLYSQCALFVMPSLGDGFGLVFLEAMMHRKPCVGQKQGAAMEIFEDGVSGILVDREDRCDLAERLSSLLLDEKRREQMGRAAYRRYKDRFTGEQYRDRFRSVLNERFALVP